MDDGWRVRGLLVLSPRVDGSGVPSISDQPVDRRLANAVWHLKRGGSRPFNTCGLTASDDRITTGSSPTTTAWRQRTCGADATCGCSRHLPSDAASCAPVRRPARCRIGCDGESLDGGREASHRSTSLTSHPTFRTCCRWSIRTKRQSVAGSSGSPSSRRRTLLPADDAATVRRDHGRAAAPTLRRRRQPVLDGVLSIGRRPAQPGWHRDATGCPSTISSWWKRERSWRRF